jgi:arylformamidase
VGKVRYIDLSGALEDGMWGYFALPGLEDTIPPARIETIATIERNGFFASRFSLSSVTGTYLEAGSHFLRDGKLLEDYPLDRFFGDGALLRLPEQKPGSRIERDHLAEHAPPLRRGDALLIDTGWWKRWNREGYVRTCPHYSRSALLWILEQGISILGVDVPCIEAAWSEEDEGEKGSLIGELFKRDILLAAPLVNLGAIGAERGRIVCLPLSIRGTSGSPARIVFIEETG